MAHYVVNPSEESDPLKFMHRWDLYQWADENDIEYAKDAAAEVMKTLIRAHGVIPTLDRFKPIHDSMGNVVDWRYKRLPTSEAPRSRHADADEAATRKVLKERRAELERMNLRQLTRRVKDQFGPKVLERDLSREDMIAMFVGEAEEGDGGSVLSGPGITKEIDADWSSEDNLTEPAHIPDEILSILTPPQLVKLCKERGIEAKMKDGKAALLEKIRGYAA